VIRIEKKTRQEENKNEEGWEDDFASTKQKKNGKEKDRKEAEKEQRKKEKEATKEKQKKEERKQCRIGEKE